MSWRTASRKSVLGLDVISEIKEINTKYALSVEFNPSRPFKWQLSQTARRISTIFHRKRTRRNTRELEKRFSNEKRGNLPVVYHIYSFSLLPLGGSLMINFLIGNYSRPIMYLFQIMKFWQKGRRAFSKTIFSCSVPMDMATLEGLRPIEYLEKFGKVAPRRERVYKQVM